MTDTIAAIATAYGEGGIGIVRISGPEAFAILNRVFVYSGKGPIRPRRAVYLFLMLFLQKDSSQINIWVYTLTLPVIYDGRNIYDKNIVKREGFELYP